MKTYTPGPWRSGDRFNTIFGPPNGNPSPQTIATVFKGHEGNARLLSAAPELLEAVMHVLIASEDNGSMSDIDWEMLRAVAKKAGGL